MKVKSFLPLSALALSLGLLAGCASASVASAQATVTDPPATSAAAASSQAEQDKDIVVLYTNDVHCAVEDNIGYAGLSAYKKSLQEDNYVLLADAGDSIQGAPIGTLSTGEYIIELMNQVGYDVAIPGNHEFDYGMDRFLQLTQMADFPYVSCNFTDLSTDTTVFPPYVMQTCGATKIAFVGVTTPRTITSSTPDYFKDAQGEWVYGFDQDADGTALYTAVQSAVDAARDEGADYVIAVTHLGIIEGMTPYTSNELIAATSGIDVVLDGHSHSVIEQESVKNAQGQPVLLTSTGTQLVNIGRLNIGRDGTLSTQLIADYTEKDPEVEAFVSTLNDELGTTLEEVVAQTAVELTVNDPATGERIVRNAETNLGDLLADAYRASCGADVALVNGGGVRASIEAGPVTYGDIISVQPFGNLLCEVEATGQQLLDALEIGAYIWPEECGGFLQVSGLTYAINVNIPSSVTMDESGMFQSVDGEYRVHDVMVGGQPLDLEKTYTVASHAYLIKSGGDGNNVFMNAPLLQEDFILDNQALINYMTQNLNGVVGDDYADPAGAGRIVED